jgi:ELWxxDGT repeat protein
MTMHNSRNWLRNLFGAKPVTVRRPKFELHNLEDRTVPSGTPELVLDINPNTYGSNPSQIVAVGSTAYFTTTDYASGNGLWKSNGTAAGTVLLKNVTASSLTNVNGTLFFTAYDETNGQELWKSDGTVAGTTLVKDIYPGTSTIYGYYGGTYIVPNSSSPTSLTNVNGRLYFTATDGTSGIELWTSDGTEAGTVIVKDINAGYAGSYPRSLSESNGTILFSAYNPAHGFELWKSNGTAAGTEILKDIFSGSDSSDPNNLTNINGTTFFNAGNSSYGTDFWKTDGTAVGTIRLKQNFSGNQFTNVNGTLYFVHWDGTNGNEIWKSDGTSAGTVRVKALGWYTPNNLTNVNGTLYFSYTDATNGRELWKSDGTSAGTVMVMDIWPGIASGYPTQLTDVNGTLFFSAGDDTHGVELWKSDGTSAGTVRVRDINPGSTSTSPGALANINGTLFFSAWEIPHGFELWKSNGTAAGTVMVMDLNVKSYNSDPQRLVDLNGSLFFTVFDDTQNNRVWTSDGSAAGTVPANLPITITSEVANVNGLLYFTAYGPTNSNGLWKSNGTAAGTVYITPLPNVIDSPTNVNGTLFFTLYDAAYGAELWKSDGTAAGTTLVKDIDPSFTGYYGYYGGWYSFPNSSSPSALTNANGRLFFTASDGIHGRDLWTSDGTEAGTVLVKDFTGGVGQGTQAMAYVNGSLFFSASHGNLGTELWKSDGTATGTVPVADIVAGNSGSYPSSLTGVNGTLFFAANNGTNDRELWSSDGTAAGTRLVANINAEYSSHPSDLTDVEGTLYFVAYDPTHGFEIWTSDGTAAGTILVGDIFSGSNSSNLSNLTNVNGTLFFAADDGIHGRELWKIEPGVSGPPVISISGVTKAEGNTGTTAASFTVRLNHSFTETVTVHYATANATATAGTDYQAASGTLTFTPGETSKTIPVQILGDYIPEDSEWFVINLDTPANATIGLGTATGTILDDEPRIAIGDVTKAEGNTGTTSFTFQVSLSVVTDAAVKVNYSTSLGTASSGDLQAVSGTLTIPAGQLSGSITVPVLGDRVPESTEMFFVTLSTPTNAGITDGNATGTITDDEPRISIDDVSMKEGKKGHTTLFTFTVTLSAAYDQAVTMSFRTADGSATTNDTDYVAKTGSLTFAPGETSKTITIEVKGDNKHETNELFYLDLFENSSNSLFIKTRGIGTILNDDRPNRRP